MILSIYVHIDSEVFAGDQFYIIQVYTQSEVQQNRKFSLSLRQYPQCGHKKYTTIALHTLYTDSINIHTLLQDSICPHVV